MEEDGFTLVSNKKALKIRKLPKLNYLNNQKDIAYDDVELKTSVRKIQYLQETIQADPKCMDILSQYIHVSDDKPKFYDQIVAYGLGSISSCRVARIQTALLLILKNYLNIKVESYDPAFSPLDQQTLNYYGIKVLKENEKCMRHVKGKNVIFYMPHCDLPLYNNLLWANWSVANLSHVSIVGNSFSKVVFNCEILPLNVRKQVQSDFKYIHMAEKLCCEFIIPLKFYPEAFNDTAIITFPKKLLLRADTKIWEENDPPQIQDSNKFVAVSYCA